MAQNTLTPAEEHVMQIMWQKNKFYIREIMEIFPEPKPHQNTVSTFLKILAEKEFIYVTKEGRVALYETVVTKEQYRMFLLKKLIENYFGGSAENLHQLLKEENMITEHENTPVTTTDKKKHVAEYIDELLEGKKHKKKKKDKKKK